MSMECLCLFYICISMEYGIVSILLHSDLYWDIQGKVSVPENKNQ